jgi:hypothetical protein
MANSLRETNRARQKLEFEVTDLTGGFVSQYSTYNVPDTYLENIQNMELVQGMWQKRKGYSQSGSYTTVEPTPGTVRGAHIYKNMNSFNLLVVSNKNLYVTNSLTSSGYKKLFDGEIPHSPYVSFADYKNDCYIAHGQGRVKKFNGYSLKEIPSPHGSIIAAYDNRILLAGVKGDPLVIYYSEQGRGHEWSALNYILLDGSSSEKITALIPAIGKLFIFTNQNIYSLAGPMDSYSVSLEVSGLGSITPNAIGMAGNKFYFIGGDYKIYEFDGGNYPIEISRYISQYLSQTFTHNALKNVRIIEKGNSVWFTMDNTKTRSERITLVYYTDYQAWTRFVGLPSAEYVTVEDTLYFIASDKIGPIFQYGTHYSDDIYAIDAYLKTVKWPFGRLENLKRFKRLYLRGAIQGGGGNGFDLTFYIDDSKVATLRATSGVASDAELWDENNWGEMYWGSAMNTAGTAWGQFEWADVEWNGNNLVFSPRWGTSTWNAFKWGNKNGEDMGDDVGKIDKKIFLSQYNVISGKYLQLKFQDKTPNHGFRIENMLLEYIQKGVR